MTKITIRFGERQDSADFFRQFGMEGAAQALEEADLRERQRRAVAVGKRVWITTSKEWGIVDSIDLDETNTAFVTITTDNGETRRPLLWNVRAQVDDNPPIE